MLSALELWGILGVGQLIGLAFRTELEPALRARYFFNKMPRREYFRAGYKRLLGLEKSGYIRRFNYVNLPGVFTLAEAGHRALKELRMARFPGFRTAISDALVVHELHVTAVGLVMTQLLGLTVRTERERFVWSFRGGRSPAPERFGISDLWIVDEERPKAVEVELTQKSRYRYRDLWATYRRRMPNDSAVLYLTKWPTGPKCILKHAGHLRADFIYVCALDDFRDSGGLAPFVNFEKGRILRLKGEPADRDERSIPARESRELSNPYCLGYAFPARLGAGGGLS